MASCSYGEAMAAFDRGSVGGVVVLGLPDDYAPRILPRVLTGFLELYPGATVDLVLDESKSLVRFLAEGSVDLAFITEGEGPVRDGPVVFTDQVVWVAPAQGEVQRRDPLPIAVWHEGDTYRRLLLEALGRMGRSYRIAVTSQNLGGLRAAVLAGLAVSVMVRSCIGPGMRELDASEGFPALPELRVRLERAHLRRSPVIDRLEQHLFGLFRGAALTDC
jgi:DNA-binding transcriptional LysR family regulator